MNEEKLQKLGSLARIDLGAEEIEELQKDLGTVLDYVSQVEKVSVDEKEEASFKTEGFLRDDVSPHETGAFSKEIIDSFPNREGDYLKVKKIL